MPDLRLIVAGSAALWLAGCLADDTPETDAVAQAEEVIEAPHPWAGCNGCYDHRLFGESFSISTSYYGVCESFGVEYECLPQTYGITVRCSAPCEVEGDTIGYGHFGVTIWPLAPGPLQAEVDMPSADGVTTFRMPTTTWHEPDGIAATCRSRGQRVPCNTPNLTPPVTVSFALVAGDEQLYFEGDLEVTSDRSGWYDPSRRRWHVQARGAVRVEATYAELAELSTIVDLDVAPRRPRNHVEWPQASAGASVD